LSDTVRHSDRFLEELSKTLANQADWHRVALFLGAAEAMREAVGAVVLVARRAEHARVVADARAALGDGIFADAWAGGRSFTREEAIAAAL
jgi:hypothetical protein